MNTIWLKIAAAAIVLLVVVIAVSNLTSKEPASEPTPEPQETRTFDDTAARDRQFLDEPQLVAEAMTDQGPAAAEQPTEPVPQQEATPQPQPAETQAQPTSPYVRPSSITKTTRLYFKPMGEIEEIEAERILPYAAAGRSLGRLPVVQYGLMVQASRQILERWPDSWYAFRAKQLLEEIYERYGRTYKITEQELDISRFLEPRPGTEYRDVEPVQP